MLDAHFPWLFYMSEAFSAGEFPLWNPYQQLGYPFYTDPQVTPWYPIAHFITCFFRFSIYSLHLYFMLHIYLAVIGMYWLLKYFQLDKSVALIMAISYGVSGFFAANGEHLLIITAATWIPFVFRAFLENIDSPNWLNTAKLAIFVSLLITGGYPQLTIIFCYFLLLLLIIKFRKVIQDRSIRPFIFYNGMAVLLSVIITLPFFFSLYESIDFVQRGGGVSLEKALFGSLTLKALVYNLIPFSLIKDSPENFGVNTSLNNLYFGIITLCFLLLQLFRSRKFMDWFLFLFGMFCLFASLAKDLPIRAFLYHYLPLMQYFKFPSLFRLFSIICFLILAGKALQSWKANPIMQNKYLICFSILLIILIIFLIIPDFGGVFSGEYNSSSIKTFLYSFSFSDHIVFHGTIQLSILTVFIYLIKKRSFRGISFLIITDIMLSLQLNINYSLVLPGVSPKSVQQKVNTLPKGFPPPTRPNLKDAFRDKIPGTPLWRNVAILKKEPAFDAFTSVLSIDHINFMKNYPELKDSIFENPPVYLSSSIFPIDSLEKHRKHTKLTRGNVYISSKDFQTMAPSTLSSDITDKLTVTTFGPNKYEFEVTSESPQLLILLQTYFKGWRVLVNNTPGKLIKANTLFVSTLIPQGTSTVTFVYENKLVIVLYGISCTILFVLISLIICEKAYFRVRREVRS